MLNRHGLIGRHLSLHAAAAAAEFCWADMTGRPDDDKCRGGKAITESVRCSREHSGHSLPTDAAVWEAAHLPQQTHSQSCFPLPFLFIFSIYAHGNTAVNHCCYDPSSSAISHQVRGRNTLWACHQSAHTHARTHTGEQFRVSDLMFMFLVCGRKLEKTHTDTV